MATQKMAQEVIYCDLCKTTPAQMHCDPCEASLCKACVGEHMSKEQPKDHRVVKFKMRNIKPVFPYCSIHKEQTCEMYCQQCNVNVCYKCIASGSHKNHDLKELMELCNKQKEELMKKTTELETNIYPSYEKSISDLEKQIKALPEKYDKLLRDISKQGEEWHKEVDIIINKRKAEAEKIHNQNLETLQKHLAEMKTMGSQIKDDILKIKKLLKLNNVGEIMTYVSPNFKFPPPIVDIKQYTFIQLPIQGEQLLKMFGMIETSSITLPRVVRSQDTGFRHLFCVECDKQNEFWVLNRGLSSNIKFFGLTGEFSIPNNSLIEGIAVSREGDLVWANTSKCSINKMKNGNIQKIITTGLWMPNKISYTAFGDLLVCMSKDDEHRKMVIYSGSTEKQVIQYDDQKNPLFSSKELFVCGNRNRNVCVSDTGAKHVVVLNQAGQLRFHYSGNLSPTKYKSFTPTGITTDSLCQILIADRYNNCVHIIACDGDFICYVNNCELSQPIDLSINEQDVLYVAEYEGKVKVIEYLT